MEDIKRALGYLIDVRYQIGILHGSEDICVLLYSLVRRERPEVVVELGTGLGVTTAWIAMAMRENDIGTICSYDNGSDYQIPSVIEYLKALPEPLRNLAEIANSGSYEKFLGMLFKECGVEDRICLFDEEIDVRKIARKHGEKKIDMIFSDFIHGPDAVESIVSSFLPVMQPTSSIFIDSASTHKHAFLTLERIVDILNIGKIPRKLLSSMSEQARESAMRLVQESNFKLMHLTEKADRRQNSTAWIRIEPCDMVPAGTSFLH